MAGFMGLVNPMTGQQNKKTAGFANQPNQPGLNGNLGNSTPKPTNVLNNNMANNNQFQAGANIQNNNMNTGNVVPQNNTNVLQQRLQGDNEILSVLRDTYGFNI